MVVAVVVRTLVRLADILLDHSLVVAEQCSTPSFGCGVVDMVADMVLGRLAAGLGSSLEESLGETWVAPRGCACLVQ